MRTPYGRSSRTIAAALAIVGSSLLAATLGYPAFLRVGLIPPTIGPALWALILARFSFQLVVFLFQVDLVLTGRLARATLPWAAIITVQAVVIGTDLSLPNLQRALLVMVGCGAVLTLAEGIMFMRRISLQTS